jgi:2-polyprenyl-3-methyl-5-hydroxy-6-metoxy-1,4-benzoquinol methylase
MREDAIKIEETRLENVNDIADYPDFHERHRVFPAIFENRQHKRILDIAAGVGCAAQRVHENYPADLLCNDITPKCLNILKKLGLSTVSFDLDDASQDFPFPDGHFDAIIGMATIEHIIHIDHFVQEIHRVLKDDGYLYMTTPNYGALVYLPRFLLQGKTFHDPLSKSSRQRYEFYGHVRYFTYRSMVEYVSSFGLVPDTVYLALPAGSTRYQALSKPKALAYRYAMTLMYYLLSPRWASEPIVCFRKSSKSANGKMRKVVL